MTYLWKCENGYYAFQTDDKHIAKNMKRRGFVLSNEGMNCNHWVFHARMTAYRNAIKALKALTHRTPIYNNNTEVWEC